MSNKVYQIVTDEIVAMLDKGIVPWRRGWTVRGSSIARNAWDKPYRGINVFILAFERAVKGYKSNTWMTFKQIQKVGGSVIEGSKSTVVIFWTLFEVEDRSSKTGKKRVPVLRYFRVFNLDQTTGVKLTKKQKAQLEAEDQLLNPEFNPYDDAEAIIGTYLASDNAPAFVEGGSQPAYSPSRDTVTLPVRSDFVGADEYYATAFHEFIHSTGIKSRLNRQGVETYDHFGSQSYAKEELVAELGSAFLCAEVGIDNTRENSAAYISGWKRRLSDDPTLIVSAASQAQKAAEYIMGTTFEKEEGE